MHISPAAITTSAKRGGRDGDGEYDRRAEGSSSRKPHRVASVAQRDDSLVIVGEVRGVSTAHMAPVDFRDGGMWGLGAVVGCAHFRCPWCERSGSSESVC